MKLSSRVVLITGASEGIGRACVGEFQKRGAKLVLAALPGPECDRLSAGGHLVTTGDLAIPEVRERFVQAALTEYGRVDVLINNAGVGLYADPTATPLDLGAKLFGVNVFTPLALAQMVAPIMRRHGKGTIVNVGSVGGYVALPWAAMYCSSKFALHALTDSLRRELRRDGIHVMKVCPGIVRTNFRSHVLAGQAPDKVEAIRRTVSPQAVATAIADGIEANHRVVYTPRIGRLFCALDFLAPMLMDWYLETQSRPLRDGCRDAGLAKLP
jgi:short-subunit dehydrogenase